MRPFANPDQSLVPPLLPPRRLTASVARLRGFMALLFLSVAMAGGVLVGTQPGLAQAPAETRPYDDRLFRLAEILGAIHYLRELCGSDDGQLWRLRMQDLIGAEGTSALRRARLTRSFNQGYRSYARTYTQCTPTAKTAIGRFFAEATQLTSTLSRIP